MSANIQALAALLAEALGAERPVEAAARFVPSSAGSPVAGIPQIRRVMLADGTIVEGTVVAKPRVKCERCGRSFYYGSSGIEQHNVPSGLDPDKSRPARALCTDATAAEYRAWVAAQK